LASFEKIIQGCTVNKTLKKTGYITASLNCPVLSRLQFSERDMLCIAGKAEMHINIDTAMDAVLLARV